MNSLGFNRTRDNEDCGLLIHKKEILKTPVISLLQKRKNTQLSPKVIQHLAEIRQVVSHIQPDLSFYQVGESEAAKFEIKRVLGVGNFAVVKLMKRKTDGSYFAGKFVSLRLLKSREIVKNIKVS